MYIFTPYLICDLVSEQLSVRYVIKQVLIIT